MKHFVPTLLFCSFLLILGFQAHGLEAQHGIAMHGKLKYPPGFRHFDYVNPDAPKGGKIKLSALGTFDSLNPFILKGQSANGTGRLFDTLLTSSDDEAFSEYGLIAESIEFPADRSRATFNLRKQARFHDGSPVTAEDVAFTFNQLKTKGHPFYRSYYGSVKEARIHNPHRIEFIFDAAGNRELPLIIGQLPVLSKASFQNRDFAKTSLQPLVGSGPYKVKKLDAGRSITYVRDPDYWGVNLNVNIGQNNMEQIHIEYYRDSSVAFEAFKAGEYDFIQDNNSKNWATGYNIPQVRDGRIIKENIRHEQATGMQAFIFNTRREQFADSRVRQALGYLFDFEWANKNLFYGAYTRTESFFSNSELASSGLPSKAELAILEPYRGKIPETVFTQAYQAPQTDGKGSIRKNLRQALRLMQQAGWEINAGKLTHIKTGQNMKFEILLVSPSFERIVLPYKKNLQKLGVEASVRTIDSTQYQNRVDGFDFDMIIFSIGQSLSPGNEQRDFWGSDKANIKGSRNLIGIKDPVIDELIETLINAKDRQALISATRALDRVLLHNHYVIPHWHIRNFRVAYWNKFESPSISPKYALGFNTWWLK